MKIEGLTYEQVGSLLALLRHRVSEWRDCMNDANVRGSVWGQLARDQHDEAVALLEAIERGTVEA